MSDDLNIGMAAGIGAAQAAAQSQATHAATMAGIEQQRMAGNIAHSDKVHMIEKMIIVRKVTSYVAGLKLSIFAHKSEKKTVIDELKRLDPPNKIAKKAENNEYSQEIYHTLQNDPIQSERFINEASELVDKVIREN